MARPVGREVARSLTTLVSVFALVAALVVSMAATAHAARTDSTPTHPSVSAALTDVSVSDGHVHGLLTVSSPRDTVTIDAKGVRIRLADGEPVTPTVTTVEHQRRAVMLVIDTSGSMGKTGIAAASAAARTFLRHVPSDVEVGLTSFAQHSRVVKPTTDRSVVLGALKTLKANGETALYDGLDQAIASLPDWSSKTVLLLSDGGDTVSRESLATVLQEISQQHVRLDAVSFRTKESDNKALGALSAAGQGRVLEVADGKALNEVFNAAATALAGQLRISLPVPDGLDGKRWLQVSGTANGIPFTARAKVTLPSASKPTHKQATSTQAAPSPAAGAPVTSARGGWLASPRWLVGSGLLVFLGLLALGLAVASPVFLPAHKRRIRSLDQFVGTSVQQRAKAATSEGSSALANGALKAADRWARGRASSARTAMLLERADMPLRVNEWYVLRAVAVIVGIALFMLLWHGSLVGILVGVLVGGVLGGIAPVVLLRVKAGLRARKFEAQLPDVLTLVASSLSTGFSLAQAIDAITHDASEPSAKEYSRALAETRIGAEIEDSLERLAVRMDSTNLKWTVMAIRIQRQVGGNLAETLRTTAATLRDRESLKRQVKALSAEGKLSAYILIALPIGLFGYMMMVNRPYISLLWTTLLGIGMLIFALISLVIGTLWMRKVVVVEV